MLNVRGEVSPTARIKMIGTEIKVKTINIDTGKQRSAALLKALILFYFDDKGTCNGYNLGVHRLNLAPVL